MQVGHTGGSSACQCREIQGLDPIGWKDSLEKNVNHSVFLQNAMNRGT